MSVALKLVPKEVFPKKDGRSPDLVEGGCICLSCGEGKVWDHFHKDVNGFNKKTATCITCRNVKGRQVYKDNPIVRRSGIKNRPDRLKRLYGVTYEQIVRVLDEQHGLCANRGCGKEISLEIKGSHADRAVIDHDHKTGKFRAMLCSPCNVILGMLETRENTVLGLYDYLNKHKGD